LGRNQRKITAPPKCGGPATTTGFFVPVMPYFPMALPQNEYKRGDEQNKLNRVIWGPLVTIGIVILAAYFFMKALAPELQKLTNAFDEQNAQNSGQKK
jgi:hypothetical protein